VTERVVGAAIALFGGWFLWQAGSLREGPGYAAIGPRVFPVIVGLGLLLSGLALLLQRGSVGVGVVDREDSAGDSVEPIVWPSLTQVAALLAAYVVAFLPLGFIVSSTIFVVGGARVLGSQRWVRDLTVAVLLSAMSYGVFTFLLGLDLPGGPLEMPLQVVRGYSR
jgi:putative tricarboxylic transport membrane protein